MTWLDVAWLALCGAVWLAAPLAAFLASVYHYLDARVCAWLTGRALRAARYDVLIFGNRFFEATRNRKGEVKRLRRIHPRDFIHQGGPRGGFGDSDAWRSYLSAQASKPEAGKPS